METPRLECRDLRRVFDIQGKPLTVLDGVSFEVAAGETVVIRGRSGQGKSVLLWLLSGIDQPTSGAVCLDGRWLGELREPELAELRRTTVGLVFQSFHLIEAWTALENVQAALAGSGLPWERQRALAMSLLARLGLSERFHNLPCQLSAGQQQRVAIARALVNSPSLLLADEPSGDVDPETAAEVVALLRGYVAEQHAAMVVATHGAYPVADDERLLRLANGRLEPGR